MRRAVSIRQNSSQKSNTILTLHHVANHYTISGFYKFVTTNKRKVNIFYESLRNCQLIELLPNRKNLKGRFNRNEKTKFDRLHGSLHSRQQGEKMCRDAVFEMSAVSTLDTVRVRAPLKPMKDVLLNKRPSTQLRVFISKLKAE